MTVRDRLPMHLFAVTLATTLAFVACDDKSSSTPLDGGAPSLTSTLVAPPAPIGLAVVHSDYMSMAAAVSLLAPVTGAIVRDNCINSGTKAPEITALLSSDIVLPSNPQPGNRLVVIDRKQATLTWVDPATCAIVRQLDVAEGFRSNPYDLLDLGAKAYVPRYNASTTGPARGSDLLIIDSAAKKLLGRIDLQPWATMDAAGKTVLPRPDRLVFHEGKIYVSLNELGEDYAPGAGRVVVVDPTTDTVTGAIDLPGLQNCGAMDLVPGEKPGLVIGCAGSFSDPVQATHSGLAWIDLSSTPPTVEILPAATFGRAVSLDSLGVVDAHLGFTILAGDFSGPSSDELWAFDFAAKTARKVREGGGDLVYGLFLDRNAKRLFLTDADPKAPKVHVYSTEGAGDPTLLGSASSSPSTGLPPRGIAWY